MKIATAELCYGYVYEELWLLVHLRLCFFCHSDDGQYLACFVSATNCHTCFDVYLLIEESFVTTTFERCDTFMSVVYSIYFGFDNRGIVWVS